MIPSSKVASMASNTRPDAVTEKGVESDRPDMVYVEENRDLSTNEQLKEIDGSDHNLRYDEVDDEPEIHLRTYVAVVAMFLLNLVQVLALQAPPAVVRIP